MYVFDRDVHLYFWNIECTQRKLAVDEALRANVVINIVYIKKRLQSNLRQYNEPLYNEVLDMIERTIFFIPVIINLNIKKNFDITKPRYSWRANLAPPPPLRVLRHIEDPLNCPMENEELPKQLPL